MWRIFTTEEFEKDLKKLDGSDQQRVREILKQLKRQGSNVGKPLAGPPFLEKRDLKEKEFTS